MTAPELPPEEAPAAPAAPGPVRDRGYDLTFNREYTWPAAEPPEPEPAPPPPGEGALVSVRWDGMEINPGNTDQWFTGLVENVENWYGTPEFDGRDTQRELADGAAYGYKTIRAREVTITGAAAGPREPLMRWRDDLARRAAAREPAELAIGDPWLPHTLTAMVRAGSGAFQHTFIAGRAAFRYQVVLTAADPLLYEQDWHQAVLTTRTAADAGRAYPRGRPGRPAAGDGEPSYPWAYGSPYPEGSAAFVRNDGNAAAPLWLAYEGDLTESRLTDDTTSILLEPVPAGVALLVDSQHVTAEAEGGYSRAAFIRPGSRPVLIPPFATSRLHLYAQGSGSVTVAWRSAWI